MSMIGLFAALTALGGFLSLPLPLTPVPFSLQLIFTLMAGILLGGGAGALSQLVYILIGAVGLPVFAGRMGGVFPLVGPTAGYIWGFVLAALITGYLYSHLKKESLIFPLLVLGLMIIYIMGVMGLMLVTGLDLKSSLLTGVVPFILPDLFKLLAAYFLLKKFISLSVFKQEVS